MWIMWIMCAFSPRSLPCAVALWHCQCGILRARTFNYIFIVMADSAAMDWEQLLQMSCKFLSEWYQLAISNTSPYFTTISMSSFRFLLDCSSISGSHFSTEKLCMAACHAFHACRIRSMCPSLWTGKPPSVKCSVLFSEFLVGNPYCIRSTAAEACPLFA